MGTDGEPDCSENCPVVRLLRETIKELRAENEQAEEKIGGLKEHKWKYGELCR